MAKRHSIKNRPHDRNVNHGPSYTQGSLVGPFPGSVTPARSGIYLRESPRTKGRKLWSYWNGLKWGKLGSNFRRAVERKDRASNWQGQQWYGLNGKS